MPATKNPALLERNAQRIFGCSRAELLRLNEGRPAREHGSAALRYAVQRQAAKARGISWEISFPEWKAIWIASGRWEQRGVGAGRYCMARDGDTGPYHPSNVRIELCTTNSRDGVATRFKGADRHAPSLFRSPKFLQESRGKYASGCRQ